MFKLLPVFVALCTVAALLRGCEALQDHGDELRNDDAVGKRATDVTASQDGRVWIDNAPDCQANADTCQHFGLDYIRERTIATEDHKCKGGTEVLCQLPTRIPLPELQDASFVSQINVVTYNIYELPQQHIQNGQRERTCRVPGELLDVESKIDVIVFQEVFLGGCIPNEGQGASKSLDLREILRVYGFRYYTHTVGACQSLPPPKLVNGGVFIASRWPIVKEAQKIFDNYDTTTQLEALLAKGVVYAEIVKSFQTDEGQLVSKSYHIFGTHLQSSKLPTSLSARVLQAKEIYNFTKQQQIPVDEPVIYAGDMNVDLDDSSQANHEIAVLRALKAYKLSTPFKAWFYKSSYDKVSNDIMEDSEVGPNEDLDHVWWCSEYQDLKTPGSYQLLLRPRAWPVMEICKGYIQNGTFMYPNDPRCPSQLSVRDLSDHYAAFGSILFPPVIPLELEP